MSECRLWSLRVDAHCPWLPLLLQRSSGQLTALLHRFREPSHCLGAALRHAPAILVHDSEVALRLRMPLLRGQPVQPRRLPMVLRHPLPVVVANAEVELRLRVPLGRRRAPQVRRTGGRGRGTGSRGGAGYRGR